MEILLHMDGADTSQDFIDSSANSWTVTAVNTAQIDTDQSVFGGASAIFDGDSDYVTIPDNAILTFADSDWTVDFRVRFASTSGTQVLTGKVAASNLEWKIYIDSNLLNVSYSTNGSSWTNRTFAWSYSADTWYHVAVVRNGDDLKAFIDGTQIGSTAVISGTLFDGNAVVSVGAQSTNEFYTNGWIDEYRMLVGLAAWTSNFTPPSAAYKDSVTGASSSSSSSSSP
jgi:hypothetical protein